MLIMRKSRNRDKQNQFRSKFESADAFPMRQYLRTRDELIQKSILAVIQTCFAVALIIFALRVHQAFIRHGAASMRWLDMTSALVIGIFVLILVLRVTRNLRDIRKMWQEMKAFDWKVER